MADITDRVRKKAAGLLEASEVVVAALLVEPKGSYGVASLAIAALPRTTTRALGERAAAVASAGGGLAATFPKGSTALVVTDRRVVAIPSNGLGFKEIAIAYDLADMAVTENSGKGLGRRLRLTFVDDTSVLVDAQRGQPFDEFAAALK